MKFLDDDGMKFVVQTTFDMQPNIDSAAALRSAGAVGSKDNWHVARIDQRYLDKLIKDAGLKWSDTEAVEDMLFKLLNDGTLSKLRVKEGRV